MGVEILKFITEHGVCGHTETWVADDANCDALGWLANFGTRIGSGTAPLPSGGWIDLSKFAVVKTLPPNDTTQDE